MTGRNDLKAFENPCYGCQDRTAECHAVCEKYQEYARKCAELREKKAIISASYSARAGLSRACLKRWREEKRGKRRR